jgi:hypothetical protein
MKMTAIDAAISGLTHHATAPAENKTLDPGFNALTKV